ncbi:MAG: methylenetetrahydrofolate reductase [Desulfosalsimonadaceae bacterium]|nr:methylenetetrahydrofolate reductase [Desulfosalsimonadaceae bacterium]
MDLKRSLEAGDFVVIAEMEPPKGVDVAAMVGNAAKVKEEVTAFMVPEMSNAVMRMSALGGAMVLQGNRMDTIMQICCRDRNRIALQADLLAASACGIRNIMAVTGEAPSFGDHHQAAAVYDITLDALLKAIEGLQTGRDMAGIELSGSPEFLVGATLNTGLQGSDMFPEIESMKHKIDAGVRFFITPPLFDIDAIGPFMSEVKKIKTSAPVYVIPTVVLLKSLGMARYMAKNMKHIRISDALIKRIQNAPDKVRECVRIASETVSDIKSNGFSGVMISTMGWEDRLQDIIHGI